MNWLAKLLGREKRRSRRYPNPPVQAFYWDGGHSTPRKVANISHHGIYIRTEDRWYPRTLIRVTLQRTTRDPQIEGESIMLLCRVVRTDEEGIGMAIVLEEEDKSEYPISLGSQATRRELNKFMERMLSGTPKTEIPYLSVLELDNTASQSCPVARLRDIVSSNIIQPARQQTPAGTKPPFPATN